MFTQNFEQQQLNGEISQVFIQACGVYNESAAAQPSNWSSIMTMISSENEKI